MAANRLTTVWRTRERTLERGRWVVGVHSSGNSIKQRKGFLTLSCHGIEFRQDPQQSQSQARDVSFIRWQSKLRNPKSGFLADLVSDTISFDRRQDKVAIPIPLGHLVLAVSRSGVSSFKTRQDKECGKLRNWVPWQSQSQILIMFPSTDYRKKDAHPIALARLVQASLKFRFCFLRKPRNFRKSIGNAINEASRGNHKKYSEAR